MILDKINQTNDIHNLSLEEKIILAGEIREYLIDVVSKNGGHLASNLGVVELTLALESVFDLEKDKIIWDVGHQSYVHKILNGRKNELKSIRKINGISGFPKTNESSTDSFNTGHSSTSISAGLGFACSRDLLKEDYHVISVIGDGALTGGLALEALNHVGCLQARMIIILNDNEMSISRNISGMNKLLTRLRSKKNYRKTNHKGKEIISSIPAVGKIITEVVSRGKSAVKQVFVPGMYFEEIGIKYLGPVDGHNIEALEELFLQAKDFDEPVLIHVLTKKGMGYQPALENPSKFHGVGPFQKETGEIPRSGENYSKVFGRKLISLAQNNKRIVAITAAMRDGVGMGEFALKYPQKFFDVGIAEGHALTFAAGLAKVGMIPFVSIYSSFYQRGYDQIIHDICLQNLPVIMCIDRAGIVGNDGETHQGLYDLSFLKIIPNMTIFAPKNFLELEMIMEEAIKYNRPIAIRYPRGGEGSISMMVSPIHYGKCEVLKTGKDILFIGIGNMVSRCMEVSSLLEEEGYSCGVINTRFLKPLDKNGILKKVKESSFLVVLEDATEIGGLSSSIKELLFDYHIIIPSLFFHYPDQFIKQGSVSDIEKKYKMDSISIKNKIIYEIKKPK
ncbi:MAG: 1-deoxy-D-xylulose-5-phosphate synthase [Bacilli bacterium]|nr:1-deoxy-D-xylulose-5-phosphate synthase [Bacilli bacterium]